MRWRLTGPARRFALNALWLFVLPCLLLRGATAGDTVDIDRLSADYQGALQQIIIDSGAPGAVGAFVLPDGRMRRVAVGYADVEAKQPMSPHSRMLSGSVGKTFVGALALELSQEGILDLDAPISTWLGDRPWFSKLPNGSLITLRQLLTHRSGLVDHVHMPGFNEAFTSGKLDLADGTSPEQLIAFVLDSQPLFAPGEGYSYTDTGYLLIGLIIEQATGHTYYGELRRHILDPLALTDTSPSDHRRLPGLVPGYLAHDDFGQGVKTMKEPGLLFYNPRTEWTGGGLVTNAGDLARWAWLLYGGRVMTGDYLSELLNVAPAKVVESYPSYGLGQGIARTAYGVAYGHSGYIPGYLSFMGYFPDYRMSVAAQFNTTRGLESENNPITLAKARLPAVVIAALSKPQE